MANINTQFKPKSLNVTISAATDCKITNYIIPLANTEYSHSLTASLKQLVVKARNRAKLQVAFVSGDSLLNYITIWPGNVLSISDLDFNGKVLYFNCDVASTLEILELF
jgi:hypothetical protein